MGTIEGFRKTLGKRPPVAQPVVDLIVVVVANEATSFTNKNLI